MAGPPDADPAVPSAEFILASAVALVSLLIIALAVALAAEPLTHQRTLNTIAAARGVRDEALGLAQAMTAVESAVAVQARGHDAGGLRAAAELEVRARLDALRRVTANDPELAQAAADVATFAEAHLANDSEPDSIGASAAAAQRLIGLVNLRNDAARRAENNLRARLNSIGVALAVLSLLASALAILALRREREQWRMANAAAEDARAKAAASDLAKTRFLTAASHDMRQPLHALTLYLSALGRRVEGQEARDILTKADRAAQSLVGMFGVLLDLARIEAGAVKPEREDVPLASLFQQAADEHPGADIRIAPTPLVVRSDPVLLERILRNLVSNGVKHGGGQVRLAARASGADVEISISDNGPGVAPEHQARIFEEFVRLKGPSDGLGLGLAIVKRLADMLGHTIELRSAPGQGATFIVRAPLASAAARPVRRDELSLDGQAVLIADADPLARGALARVLQDMGARVISCTNERDVEAAVANGARPGYAMLDLRLNGGETGLDIAARLRGKLRPPARVLILTADTAPRTLGRLRAGGWSWLVKPLTQERLAEALTNGR